MKYLLLFSLVPFLLLGPLEGMQKYLIHFSPFIHQPFWLQDSQ